MLPTFHEFNTELKKTANESLDYSLKLFKIKVDMFKQRII